MDARAVAQISGIEVGTLNVWVQRGLVPGMSIGARGRQRNFDLKTATSILIMAELGRLGFGAPMASAWTRMCFDFPRLLVSIPAPKPTQTDASLLRFKWFGFESEEELPRILAEEFPEGPPSVYVVINAESLRARMRRAFEQWEESHQT
jgi:hypothetical protein